MRVHMGNGRMGVVTLKGNSGGYDVTLDGVMIGWVGRSSSAEEAQAIFEAANKPPNHWQKQLLMGLDWEDMNSPYLKNTGAAKVKVVDVVQQEEEQEP